MLPAIGNATLYGAKTRCFCVFVGARVGVVEVQKLEVFCVFAVPG